MDWCSSIACWIQLHLEWTEIRLQLWRGKAQILPEMIEKGGIEKEWVHNVLIIVAVMHWENFVCHCSPLAFYARFLLFYPAPF